LSLVATGMKDKHIADFAGISVRTVQTHMSRIFVKFDTQTRMGAVLKYLEIKAFDPPAIKISQKSLVHKRNYGR